MKIYLVLLMFIIGAVLALHLSMNAQVGIVLKNPKVGNAVFWVIGALTAIIIGLTAHDSESLGRLKDVPLWLLTAGAIGATLVFGIAWAIPQLGAAPAFVLMIAGQVVAGLLFSHYGMLGSPIEPITWVKVIGVLLVISGAGIVSFAR